MTKTQHLVPVVCDQTCVRKPAKYYFYLPCCAFFFFLSSLSLSTLLPVCWQDDSQGFNLKASALCEGQCSQQLFSNWRLWMALCESDEAQTQRQIKATKTLAIVSLSWVTNRRAKATQRGQNVFAFSPLSLLPSLPRPSVSLYSLDSL